MAPKQVAFSWALGISECSKASTIRERSGVREKGQVACSPAQPFLSILLGLDFQAGRGLGEGLGPSSPCRLATGTAFPESLLWGPWSQAG